MNKHLVLGSLIALPLLAAGCSGADTSSEDPGTEVDELKQCAKGATVKGVDVSYFQGHVDWTKAHAAGIGFGVARVADGHTFVDPQFAANWSGMKSVGVIRGAYQFFRPGQDPVQQADLFVKEIKDHGGLHAGDLPPVADVEVQDGVSDATLRSHLKTWLEHVESALGRRPMIYTAPGFWDGLGADSTFAKYTLWVANWETSCPTMPSSWSNWKFWQKADNGHVNGISGLVDLDVFNGSLADLKAFAGATSGGTTTHTVASIGGTLAGQPAIGKNPDGRLEVFAIGPKGNMETAFQTEAGGKWSEWFSLGGNMEGQAAVANNQDGRIEIFVRNASGALEHAWQDAPNGKIGNFASLGGSWGSDPTVARNSDGRLEVFAVGKDGALHHAAQTKANGGWASWSTLGTAGGGLADPWAAVGHDGHLRVFARGKDGATYVITQETGKWSAWKSLGGKTTIAPTAARNEDGRLEVFVRGTDGHLYHAWEKTPGGAWTGWTSLGGGIQEPFAATDADGRIEVFVRGDNKALYRTRQKAPNGAWEGFTDMYGAIAGGPVATRNKDGRLEVFFRGTDDHIHHAWESAPEKW